jgi:hypothetical protein
LLGKCPQAIIGPEAFNTDFKQMHVSNALEKLWQAVPQGVFR